MIHQPMTVEPRNCPLCGANGSRAVPFLSDSVDARRVSPSSFASRKTPEYMSHRMVRCLGCDLAYVDRPPSEASLAACYHAADYDSAEEAEDAADAYARAISPVLATLKGRGAALEIGTGTGAFLERLQQAGFAELVGVEPSPAAIAVAPAHRRGWIREGVFVEADFAPGSFDLICCFMTLEHVRDPGALVAAAHRLLAPGGVFVGVTHDYRGLLNRLLGRRSPIVDIEHMQLFSGASARALLVSRGYARVAGTSFRNAYRPSYWLRLAPIPAGLKARLGAALRGSWLDRRRLAVDVGNYMSWGFREA
jgi:SAM-dependent methyltransferase